MEDVPAPQSALLIDATIKTPMPLLALPKKEYMENAKALWEKLDLPPLKPEMPWCGYSLGDWSDEWARNAAEATKGKWMERSETYRQKRRQGVMPSTPVRTVEEQDDD